MLLEIRSVSTKTPRDGKLELDPASAAEIAKLGAEFPLTTPSGTGRGRAVSMPCTCAKGDGRGHVHHFVESPLLMDLVPGTAVRVDVDQAANALHVRPA